MYTDRVVYDTYSALMISYNQNYVGYLMTACFGPGWKSRVRIGKKLPLHGEISYSSKISDICNVDTENFRCDCGGLMGISQYGKRCPYCGTKVALKLY